MGFQIGAGYFGSQEVLSSTPNQDLIQQHKPADYSSTVTFAAYKFSFVNTSACTVLINDSVTPIYIASAQGFQIEEVDVPIYSFKIVEAGIAYNYIGAYT